MKNEFSVLLKDLVSFKFLHKDNLDFFLSYRRRMVLQSGFGVSWKVPMTVIKKTLPLGVKIIHYKSEVHSHMQ